MLYLASYLKHTCGSEGTFERKASSCGRCNAEAAGTSPYQGFTQFFWKPRKAVVAGKKEALGTFKVNTTNASTLEHQCGFGSEALTSSESPQLTLSKWKANKAF